MVSKQQPKKCAHMQESTCRLYRRPNTVDGFFDTYVIETCVINRLFWASERHQPGTQERFKKYPPLQSSLWIMFHHPPENDQSTFLCAQESSLQRSRKRPNKKSNINQPLLTSPEIAGELSNTHWNHLFIRWSCPVSTGLSRSVSPYLLHNARPRHLEYKPASESVVSTSNASKKHVEIRDSH